MAVLKYSPRDDDVMAYLKSHLETMKRNETNPAVCNVDGILTGNHQVYLWRLAATPTFWAQFDD
jgi:hypothetical protein